MKKRISITTVVALTALTLTACGGRTESGSTSAGAKCSVGITDDEIHIGNSIPQSGAVAAYIAVPNAQKAYFDDINAAGGVEMGDGKTRTIKYTTLDDQYDPARTVGNVRRLVERDEVFALLSVLGTSPNLAIADYLKQNEIPNLFALTGTDEIGKNAEAGNPWTIAALPQYEFEAETHVDYLLEQKPDAKVALLYQNDGFGKGMLDLFTGLLEGTGAELVKAETYDVASGSIDSQIVNLANSGADVFINFSTGSFMTQSLRKAADVGWKPLTLLSSGSIHRDTLVGPAGAEANEGVRSFTWLKDVSDPSWDDDEGMQAWQAFAAKHSNLEKTDTIAANGYLGAELLVKALEQTDGCTRKDLLDAVASFNGVEADLLLPGVTVGTDPKYPYALGQMKPIVFRDGLWAVEDVLVEREE